MSAFLANAVRHALLVEWLVVNLVASTASPAQTVSPAETQAIAKDAYVYSYAMLESYQTLRTQAVDKNAASRAARGGHHDGGTAVT
jgi:hypothetical protein